MREQAKALRKAHEALMTVNMSPQYDENRVKELAESAAKADSQLTVLRVRTEHEIYALLTPEQKKQLEERRPSTDLASAAIMAITAITKVLTRLSLLAPLAGAPRLGFQATAVRSQHTTHTQSVVRADRAACASTQRRAMVSPRPVPTNLAGLGHRRSGTEAPKKVR